MEKKISFKDYMMEDFGYEVKTTFWEDFSIAELFGCDAVVDTYNRAMENGKTIVSISQNSCLCSITRFGISIRGQTRQQGMTSSLCCMMTCGEKQTDTHAKISKEKRQNTIFR